MQFRSFLTEALLLEGGAALKGVSKLTQIEARHGIPDIIKKVSETTGVSPKKIVPIGSAGKKPRDDDLSGDVDLAIETTPDVVSRAISELAHEGSYRSMPGINVYSFAHALHDQRIAQVDLIPVNNLTYAQWSYNAHPKDLKADLKGAHRNEVMFAVTKHTHRNVLKRDKETKEPLEIERYYLDLSKGLMTGVQTRINEKGKKVKNFYTRDKRLLTDDPDRIAEILFGKGTTAEKVGNFEGAMKALKGPNFPHPEKRDEIIKMIKKGIQGKGLRVPHEVM